MVAQTPLEKLEQAIKSLRLKADSVLVHQNGAKISGYSVVPGSAENLIELMCRTRELNAAFVPHPVTDDQFVVYIRGRRLARFSGGEAGY